jgi:hypothetical protein
MGKGLKNFVANRGQGTRIAAYKRSNNIFGDDRQPNIVSPIVSPIISKSQLHNRAIFLIDHFFEPRCSSMIKYLINIGYIPDTIDIEIIESSSSNNIEFIFDKYYNNGYRLFFGTQKSSVFLSLCSWFEKKTDAVYFNSGSTIHVKGIDNYIPENMIRTSCDVLDNVNFIIKKIVFNFHQFFDLNPDSVFNNLFDYVDDSLPNGQVFNQVVYICDSKALTGQNYINTFNNVINEYCPGKVSFKSFVLNIGTGIKEFSKELDMLLTENPIDDNNFKVSSTKSIFVIKCTNDSNFQNILDCFSKKEYYHNLIIFNEKFMNLNTNTGMPFNSKYNFPYSFILSGGFSELGYKLSKKIFGDYNIGGEILSFIDIFTFLPSIYNRIVNARLPITRMLDYLNTIGSIDSQNSWHVKSSYLYKLKNVYNNITGLFDFYSTVMIYRKKFNLDSSGSVPDESWIDSAISSYPGAAGAVSYSSNSSAYTNSSVNFLNTNLNGVYMLFSSIQEISDYTSKLDAFFKASPVPKSTSTIFAIWKVLTNSTLAMNTTLSSTSNSTSTIVINVTAPSQSLIDGTSSNKNYWHYIHYGPISYTYASYDVHGIQTGSYTDSVTIDLDMTYSTDNYIVFFNKGNIYYNSSGQGTRGPLCVYFSLYANQVTNKQYRIGDVVSISSSTLGSNFTASIDTISSDGFTFGVTRFENENTNGITSSVLKQNTGVTMSLANVSSIAYMSINPDITNLYNNLLNLWSSNGCYYLALLPSGVLVANDYRTGSTFWSANSSFTNPGPASLRFRVLESSVTNPFPQPPTITYYIELHLLDTAGAERVKILKQSVNFNSLIYPLQLVITNDRNIAIMNAVGSILWSEVSNIYLSLTNGSMILNSGGNNGSLYSLNGLYNLSLASNGVLSFTSSSSNRLIYSVTSSGAVNLKFSYTTDTNGVPTFALGLYNSSGIQVYNILKDGSLLTISNVFDIDNNRLSIIPFVAPYIFKLSNNGDLVIVDANNNKCWSLGKADKTTVTQDNYAVVNGVSTLVTNNGNKLLGLSSVVPRQGDYATIHNPVNLLYSGATATIALVNSDKSIKAVFYDEADTTVRSKIIFEKPELRTGLITDPDDTTGALKNFMPVSNFELFNLTSSNGYFSASISENGIVYIKDNRTGRQMWTSSALALSSGQTIQKCNGLKIDNDTGSLYIDISIQNVVNGVVSISHYKFYLFQNSSNSNDNSNISSYALNMQDDGNLCLYQNNNDGSVIFLWGSDSWQIDNWSSNSGIFQAFEYSNQYVPPRLMSINGYYYLSMDFGVLGVISYINGNNGNNSSYKWIDNSSFKNICQPLFYSGQSGLTSTTSGGTSKTVYNSGSLFSNGNTNNSAAGGYWSNIYNNVISTFSDGFNTSLANNVQVVWVSENSTTGSGGTSGTFNFYYTYNNTSGKPFWAQLWISVVNSCELFINNSYTITIGGNSSSSWNNLIKYNFILQPGTTSFRFQAYNSSGRCGLSFICIPKYISSCDLFLSANTGNLMVQNVTVLAQDDSTIIVPGISNIAAYPVTNILNPGPNPYVLSFNDDGSGGSDGTLSIINSLGTSIFTSKASSTGVVDATLIVPDDRNGILKTGIKLYAQQDESELESYLWSPSGYSFFGIVVDTVAKTQSICIFDVRFTKSVYTFYTSSYTTLTSYDAISYLMLTSSGAIIAYNIMGTILHNVTNNISSYTNYTGFRLVLNDSNMLSIIGNNSSGSDVTLASYLSTLSTFENTLLSTGLAYYSGRILTSSSGDYILSLDNGSLNINNVTDTSYSSSSSNSSVKKDINASTLYYCLYKYTGSFVSSVYITFDTDGVLRVRDSSGIKFSFGSSNAGVPGYKLVLGNTGELSIYDSSSGSSSTSFGIQTWTSGTSYSEIIAYPGYTIDTSDIPENQLVSNEYNFKIPSSDSDTEEYTKIYSQNRLYYLRLEIDGSLAIYLSSSDVRIWSNGRTYSGSNNAARIGFVYDNNGNGIFGLWDSKSLSYGNTISVLKEVIYVFYLGNDRILRLVGSNGSSVIFNP